MLLWFQIYHSSAYVTIDHYDKFAYFLTVCVRMLIIARIITIIETDNNNNK